MHRFLKENGDDIAPRLVEFFANDEYKKYQRGCLDDTVYMGDGKMYVDFDGITIFIENPDFTEDIIGEGYVEFANLTYDPSAPPGDGECYAHLAVHARTTAVYLMEPSGDPELIGKDLDAFLREVKAQGA